MLLNKDNLGIYVAMSLEQEAASTFPFLHHYPDDLHGPETEK